MCVCVWVWLSQIQHCLCANISLEQFIRLSACFSICAWWLIQPIACQSEFPPVTLHLYTTCINNQIHMQSISAYASYLHGSHFHSCANVLWWCGARVLCFFFAPNAARHRCISSDCPRYTPIFFPVCRQNSSFSTLTFDRTRCNLSWKYKLLYNWLDSLNRIVQTTARH